jgi:short-subunit dehydrogenase
MSYSLANKRIFISGASAGIGAELARQCAQQACHLFIAGRRTDRLEALAAELQSDTVQVEVVQLDLSDESSITAAANQVTRSNKGLDILINNAGISQRGTTIETTMEVVDRIMEVNFRGTVHLTQALLPALQSIPESKIAVVSSIVGLFGFPLRGAYAASKHALQGYFETMQLEGDHPRVTIISPGPVRTDISLSALGPDGKPHNSMDSTQLKGVSVEKAARKTLRGIRKGKRRVYIGKGELALIYVHRWAPWAFHFLIKNTQRP